MNYKVLILNPDEISLSQEIKELGERGLSVVGSRNFEEACRFLKEDGSIQAVLTEWEVPVSSENPESTIFGPDMFQRFLNLRYDENLFLYTKEKDPTKVVSQGTLNGYFYKGDHDYDDIVDKVKAEFINSKLRAPFWEALVEYAKRSKDSWHTPGHASGYSFKNSAYIKDFYDFFGQNTFYSDLSVSVPMLDSLLHPTGVIKEAQELAARTFSSRYTFFCTNGTSTANKILLQTLVKPEEAVILDRNCHKSVHYGVIISGAEPIYLLPSINHKYGILGPVPKQRILETMDKSLAAGKKVKVIIITNCTYDGLIYDIADIVKEAHKRGIKVIVDEAWFGYARFHPEFYPCAMAAGADYATQSTHKTMSAFSQASMIHVNDPDFEKIEDFFMENFNMHTSTSPQYNMIASLDIARKQMALEGYSLLSRSLAMSEDVKKRIKHLKKFRVLGLDELISEELKDDNIRLDKTKITIDISQSGLSAHEVEHILLNKYNIQIEKTTFNTLTILITIGCTQSKINRLYLALENIEKTAGNQTENPEAKLFENIHLSISEMKYIPRRAFYCEGENVLLRKAIGKVSAGMIVPYPPGIPLVVPGQIFTEPIVETLEALKDLGVEIHGFTPPTVHVLTDQEEKELSGKGFEIQ